MKKSRLSSAIKEAINRDKENNGIAVKDFKMPSKLMSPRETSPNSRVLSPKGSSPSSPKVQFRAKLEEVNSDGEGENKVDEHNFDIDAPLEGDEEDQPMEMREQYLSNDATRDPEGTCVNAMPSNSEVPTKAFNDLLLQID